MKKQIFKTNNKCNVTFSLPAKAVNSAKKVALVGDFNNWDVDDPISLKKQKNGSFQVKLKLERGQDYQFRYLIDNTKWENDWEADKYETTPLGVDNSVVCL
ncbi:MAG: isoamylase early set domain-containing protein [Bacteroidia bacterium]|nr:isoamylase early set domain-containing protein [Bacteroidia bacterium]